MNNCIDFKGPSEEIEGGDSETTSDMSVDTEMEDDLARQPEKFLIFTTGSKTYTPHQIGIYYYNILLKPVIAILLNNNNNKIW